MAMAGSSFGGPVDVTQARASTSGSQVPQPYPEGVLDTTVTSGPQVKPNVILFLTDDMRADDMQYMPAVQQLLVQRGVTFTNALAANSLCCPARASLLTGQQSHNHMVMSNIIREGGGWQKFKERNDQENLLPVWLQAAGYRTWHIGKHLNGFRDLEPQPGWDYWNATLAGATNYEDWAVSVNGTYVEYQDSYQETVAREHLLEAVDAYSPSSQPFFMWDSALAPHGHQSSQGSGPPRAEPQHAGSYRGFPFPVSPAVGEEDITDKPAWVAQQEDPGSDEVHLAARARRIEALLSVDDTVRQTVRALRQNGDYAETVFIFTSDNGFSLWEHRRHGKNVPYEESIRIPLVIAGPGFTPGTTVEAPVALTDVTATILDIAGARSGLTADGLSTMDMDTDLTLGQDRPIGLEGGVAGFPNSTGLPVDDRNRFYWGARWGNFKYVEYATGEKEFYNLRADPYELINRYRTESNATVTQQRLTAWVQTHKDCVGNACNDPLPRLSR